MLKINNLLKILPLFLWLLHSPAYAASLLERITQWGDGTSTLNQPATATFRGGVTADNGKTFATSFDSQQKLDVLADMQPAPEHQGKLAHLYLVAKHNNVWYMKNSQGEWRPWDYQLKTLVPHTSERKVLQTLESLIVQAQLTNLAGEFQIFVGYQVDQEIYYNLLPLKFSVIRNDKPAANGPVVAAPKNTAPIADAGSYKDVNEGIPVTLDASNSRDPDGSIVSYHWEQTKGTPANLNNVNSAKPSFVAPEVNRATDLQFKLTVTDNQGAIATSTVDVTVRDVPVIDPQVITEFVPNPVPTCNANQVLTNGVCETPVPVCVGSQVLQNGVCVTPPPTCNLPQVLQNGVCITPAPTPTTTPGFTISGVSGNTASLDSIAEFSVSLTSAPLSNVVIPVASSNPNEGVTDQSQLVFTPDNWNQPQTTVVRGRNANVVNGKQDYSIMLSPAQSSDSLYSGLDPNDVPMLGLVLELLAPDLKMPFVAEVAGQIDLNANYNGKDSLQFSLLELPDNVELDASSGVIAWTPAASDSGHSVTFKARVTDGTYVSERSFIVTVATTTPVSTSVQGNTLTVNDGNLKGFSITPQNGLTPRSNKLARSAVADVSAIQIESLPADKAPAFPSAIKPLSDFFIIKGTSTGSEFTVELPLQAVPENSDLLRVKLYNYAVHSMHDSNPVWGTRGYDPTFDWTPGSKKVTIKLASMKGIFVLGLAPEQQSSVTPNILSKKSYTPPSFDKANIDCTPGIQKKDGKIVVWYGNQSCTVKTIPGMNVHVLGFGDNANATRWHGATIKELIGWLVDAQSAFDDLGLTNYDKDFFVYVESGEENPYFKNPNILGYVSSGDKRKTLHLNSEGGNLKSMKNTTAHEYFHHVQDRVQDQSNGDTPHKAKWMVEGTAAWFSDYLYDLDNGYVDLEGGWLLRFLEAGLMASDELYNDTDFSTGIYRPYQRFAFWKLIESRCGDFKQDGNFSLTKMFNSVKPMPVILNDTELDTYNSQEFIKLVEGNNCNFGNHFGPNNKSKLETGLLWYQYATILRKNFTLLDDNEPTSPLTISDTNLELSLSPYKILPSTTLITNYPAYSAYSLRIMPEGGKYTVPLGEEVVLSIPSNLSDLLNVSLIDYQRAGNLKTSKATPLTIGNIKGVAESTIDSYPMFWTTTQVSGGAKEIIFKSGAVIPNMFVTVINPNTTAITVNSPITLLRRNATTHQAISPSSFVPKSQPTRTFDIFVPTANGSSNVVQKRLIPKSIDTAQSMSYKSFNSFLDLMQNFGFKLDDETFTALTDGSLKLNQLTVTLSGSHLTYNGLLQPYSLGAPISQTLTANNINININASQFTYDADSQRYELSFATLFKSLDFTRFDDSLVTLNISLAGEFNGVSDQLNASYTYATVTRNDTVPTGSGKLTGHVYGSNGQPLQRATLQLMPSAKTVYTNAQGGFTIDNLAAGAYTLEASKDGYPTNTVYFGVSGENFSRISSNYALTATGFNVNAEIKLVLPIPVNTDSDNDGMPDVWEIAHGLDPAVNDAALDKDGDKVSNLQEYLDGTEPADKNSFLPGSVPVICTPPQELQNGICVTPPVNVSNQFTEDFLGTLLDQAKWTPFTNGNGSGNVSVSGGLLNLECGASVNTKNKFTFSGGKIVIESRLAGLGSSRDSYIALVDVATGNRIHIGDTNYRGWGEYIYGTGSFDFDPNTDNAKVGSSVNFYKEYRITLESSQVTVERGDTLSTISDTRTVNLHDSILGKTFYLEIGTGGPVHCPATFDWVKVSGAVSNLSNGLVGHWSFDDCSAKDVSGNGHDGLVNGNPQCIDGIVGKALSFNGSSDYVTVNSDANYPATAITLSYWVNHQGTAINSFENFLSKDGAFQSYLWGSGKFQSGLWTGQAGVWSGYEPTSFIASNNQSIHYAFTFDNATQIAKTYINGKLVDTYHETNPNAVLRQSDQPLYIGRNGSQAVYYIKGMLDEVRIHNRALSDAEVELVYVGDGGQNVTLGDGLVAHWSFDDCTAKDVSGNGHDGSISGNLECIDGVNGTKAMRFHADADHISAIADASFSSKSITLSAWINSTGAGDSNPRILGVGPDGTSGQYYSLILEGVSNNRRLWLCCNDEQLLSSQRIADNSGWHHVVSTIDGTTAKLYIDGKLDTQTTNHTPLELFSNSLIQIGYSDNYLDQFVGGIDDLRIYNRALSEAEVQAVYVSDGGNP